MVTKIKPRKLKHKNEYDNLMEGVGIWTSFYRANPHRLVLDYLQLEIFAFQMILLYMMNICNKFVFIACRGLGKSYLTALFCVVRCILYPGTKIILASGNKKQAGLIITEKIAEMRNKSVALDKEILDIKTNHDNIQCIFRNGSFIRATTSGDGARGARGNVLVVDEYRLVKKTDIDSVLKQFLTSPRRPGFLKKDKYKNYPLEMNKELYLSSAWYKSHWSWDKFYDTTVDMCNGKNAFSCDIPYTCSLDHGILMQEKIDEDRKDIGEVAFLMEYCGIWYGENEKSYFKSNEINQCRVLKTPFYPMKDHEYVNEAIRKVKLKQMPKLDGEIRIMGADIAIEGGDTNDNSIYTLMRLIPNSSGYSREVVWMEAHNGKDPEWQSIRLKQLFTEFNCDKIIVDTNGNGTAVLTELQKAQYDDKRDVHYESFIPYNKNPDIDMALGKGGLPVIYAMKAYEKTNSDIAIYLKNAFMTKKMRLLMDDAERKEELAVSDSRFAKDYEYQIETIIPFLQTTYMVHEIINLEYEVRNSGNIAIKEVGRNRKDRYSSIGYTNYLAQLIENEEEANKRNATSSDFLFLN